MRACLSRCATDREKVFQDVLKVRRSRGKKILTAVSYGGSIPREFVNNDFLIEVLLILAVACSFAFDRRVRQIRSPEINKKNPDMSTLSHRYLAAEDCVLTAWCD